MEQCDAQSLGGLPVGWSRFPLMCVRPPKSIDDGRATTTRGSDETYLAGAQSEENNCNGLGACRPC